MKYLITESQFDKVIFRYLDSQNLIRKETENKIYFVTSEDDVYSTIRIDKEDFFCEVSFKLVDELMSFFSITTTECWDLIIKWLSDTQDIKVLDIWSADGYFRSDMIINRFT